jgi:hypothetical protein
MSPALWQSLQRQKRALLKRLLTPTNEPSHAVKHGSEVCVTASGANSRVALLGHSRDTLAPAPTLPRSLSHVLIIAALLTLASGICLGQPAPASGIFDGDIREAVQELREARKAQQEFTAESREWRGIFDRTERRFDGKFLDRIGTLVWLAFWLAIVAMVSVTVACAAYGMDKIAGVVKSAGEAVKAWRGEA